MSEELPEAMPEAKPDPASMDMATLRARVAELETALGKQQLLLDERRLLFQNVFDKSPGMMVVLDRESRIQLLNQRMREALQLPIEQILGRRLNDFASTTFLSPEAITAQREADEATMLSGQPSELEVMLVLQGELRTLVITRSPIVDGQGQVSGLIVVMNDISERKRAEEERASLSRRIIEAQEAALREISTPLIPITDGVLVMPLIGSIDSTRAQQILDSLLEGISTRRVQMAILDVTGLRVVDTHAARALVQAAHSARLLGAQVLLTGIRADVAQALVQLGADLSSLVTLSNLQSGIAYALRHLGRSGIV